MNASAHYAPWMPVAALIPHPIRYAVAAAKPPVIKTSMPDLSIFLPDILPFENYDHTAEISSSQTLSDFTNNNKQQQQNNNNNNNTQVQV